MSDRAERARAEAERHIHVYGDDFKARTLQANLNDAFVQGVAWADENPKLSITEYELNEAAMAIADLLPARGTPAYVLIETALRTLGIEVTDDE